MLCRFSYFIMKFTFPRISNVINLHLNRFCLMCLRLRTELCIGTESAIEWTFEMLINLLPDLMFSRL